MKKVKVGVLIFALLLPLLVGMFSAFLSAKGMKVYGSMSKPPLSPPPWVFSVAWTILYLMMGLASYFVIVSESEHRTMALIIYVIQLAMNFYWTIIFFNMGMYLFAFMWLVGMLALVLVCTSRFFVISTWSGMLMVPYVLWLMFAAYLNMGSYVLSVKAR